MNASLSRRVLISGGSAWRVTGWQEVTTAPDFRLAGEDFGTICDARAAFEKLVYQQIPLSWQNPPSLSPRVPRGPQVGRNTPCANGFAGYVVLWLTSARSPLDQSRDCLLGNLVGKRLRESSNADEYAVSESQ